jgi:glycosyltransferase involved in cell wall biosynthesis
MKQNNFLIVVPSYNTAPYIRKCLESAINQTYQNFKMIVVDDACTDGTSEIIEQVQKESDTRFVLRKNPVRTESPLGNFALGISLMEGDREDIIVTLDGDDWLADKYVLQYLNLVYQDREIWMTYGSFISASGKIQGMCRQLQDTRNYRKSVSWCTSHLRTIKRKLWVKIKDGDLRDGNGKYYVYYPDAAYMFPAIEMAGLKHSKFIEKVLYVYNDLSPLCSADDWKTKDKADMREIYKISREIRMKRVYNELSEL